MTDTMRFSNRFVVCRQSLIGKPKRQQRAGEIVQAHDARIEGVNKRRRSVLSGIVEGKRLLQMYPGAGELAGRQRADAGGPMSKEGEPAIVARFRQFKQAIRCATCLRQFGSIEVVKAETVKNRKELTRLAQLITKLARATVGGRRRRCGEAMCRDMRAAERQLDCKFPPRTLFGRGHRRKPAQGVVESGERLRQDRARKRSTTGEFIVLDSLFDKARLTKMVGKQFGLGGYDFGEALLENQGDPSMELLTAAEQQAAVRRILHKCMLEGVACLTVTAAAENKARPRRAGSLRAQVQIQEAQWLRQAARA